MRKGYTARLVFDASGRLKALATGSDACAEHEGGSRALQNTLSATPAEESALIAALKRGEKVNFPNLLETKRITKFPADLQFIEVPGASPQIIFGCARTGLANFRDELAFYSEAFSSTADLNVVGAWDQDCFAIRVRGTRYVTALREFYSALREGKVLFAGTFLEEPGTTLSGVILANSELLSDKDLAEAEDAQRKFESKLRLKARDESYQLMVHIRQLWAGTGPLSIGHLWPVWADSTESEVLYALNPGSQIKADYYGPYTKEALLEWAKAQGGYRLKPQRAA